MKDIENNKTMGQLSEQLDALERELRAIEDDLTKNEGAVQEIQAQLEDAENVRVYSAKKIKDIVSRIDVTLGMLNALKLIE